MTLSRAVLAAPLVLAALVLQTVVVARLHLPYGSPDLVLLVVVALALVGGAGLGMGVGFGAGLVVDLLSDHPAGLLALVLLLVGYTCGHLAEGADDTVIASLTAVAAAAVASTLGYAALLGIIGSARLDWLAVAAGLPASVAYDLVLAAFLVPAIAALDHRLRPREAR